MKAKRNVYSIKFKLPLLVTALVTVVCLVIGTFTGTTIYHILLDQNIDNLVSTTSFVGSAVDEYLSGELSAARAIGNIPEIKDPNLSPREKIQYLIDSGFADMATRMDIYNADGSICDTNFDETPVTVDTDHTYRDMLYNDDLNEFIRGPYTSTVYNTQLVKFVIANRDENNKLISIFSLVNSIDDLNSYLANISSSLPYNGFPILLDVDGYVSYHPNSDLIDMHLLNVNANDPENGELARLGQTVINVGKLTNETFKLDGIDYYARFVTIPTGGGKLIVLISKTALMKQIGTIIAVISLLLVLATVVIVLALVFVINKLCKRLTNLKSIVSTFSEGDFNFNIDSNELEKQDEISDIFNAINNSAIGLSSIMLNVKNNTDTVSQEMLELQDAYKTMQDGSKNISADVELLSTSNKKQAEDLTQIMSTVHGFSDMLETTISNINGIDAASQTINAKAESSMDDMKNMSEILHSIGEIFVTFIESTNSLFEQVASIKGITDAINHLSEETSLLSLNASLEASRAGEAGKSFSIIAKEVTNLAEQCRQSAISIGKKLDVIESLGNQVQSITGKLNDGMNSQRTIVESSFASYNDIM